MAEHSFNWDKEADVVVVGYGFDGGSAFRFDIRADYWIFSPKKTENRAILSLLSAVGGFERGPAQGRHW